MELMISRRVFFGLGAAAGPALWATQVEPDWHEVTVTRIRRPHFPALRILHLADLHCSDGLPASSLLRALEMGLERRPDLICLTGDYVTTTKGFDEEGLRRIFRRASDSAPTYGVMGNHDGGQWLSRFGGSSSSYGMRQILAGEGVTVLHNESAQLPEGIELVGMGDLFSGEFRMFSGVSPGPRIVLCHNPDGKDSLTRQRWDLMLSGHTHGGQVRVWPVPSVWAPVQDKRYLAGLYEWEGRHLFITRGAGSPKHVRFGCRPEVSILELGT
jgi:predicted MPP superfamily phosphohydrolase